MTFVHVPDPQIEGKPLMPHKVPDRPFQEISVDLAHCQCLSRTYLVLVDHSSKWMEVKLFQPKTAKAVISILKEIFAQHGIPEIMYGDNNPFGALEMLKFASLWDFEIIKSSPR